MIYGIGIDIQSISQIEEALNKHNEHFMNKIFTQPEIEYCSRHRLAGQHFAARWAVKEAFMKAMGTGIGGGYTFQDIEVHNRKSGQPALILYKKAKEDFDRLGLQAWISLSHSGEYAIGQVILEFSMEDTDY